jgi:hypothetical protein
VITINSSLLRISLNSSVIKTPFYNDTKFLHDVVTESVFLDLTGDYDNDNEFFILLICREVTYWQIRHKFSRTCHEGREEK